jgi:hypothetical protein
MEREGMLTFVSMTKLAWRITIASLADPFNRLTLPGPPSTSASWPPPPKSPN